MITKISLCIFIVSLITSLVILATKKYHLKFTAKGHLPNSPQSSHRKPTSRIGGLSVIFGFLAGVILISDAEVSRLAMLLSLSAIPVFIGGFGEDIGFNIKPKFRLILSFLSALIAGLLLEIWIPRIGIPYFNYITDFVPTAIILTILISAGVSHSINLIDGLNGLALGVSLLIALGLAGIAYSKNDLVLVVIIGFIIFSILGLLVLNFPFGKIFLGDAGAYSIGHVLTWVSILLISRHEDIAPFAILLIFFWPVTDMIFAICRRYFSGKPLGQPDKLHYHQLIMRILEIFWFGDKKQNVTNPLATLIILPLAATPVVVAQFTWKFGDKIALAAFIGSILFFLTTYFISLLVSKKFIPNHNN